MQPLGRNHGGYRGETIDIDEVLLATERVAKNAGWTIDPLPGTDGAALLTLHRAPASGRTRRRLYLSAGIHGDEPAGPLAVLRLLRDDLWPDDLALWVCACLNPAGFRLNRRENEAGVDLNRDYRHLRTLTARRHVQWLESLPAFDCAVCLHEDWEAKGFYLYELNSGDQWSCSRQVVERVEMLCPIDLSPTIDGKAAQGGVIRPPFDPNSRPEWPEAFYLITHKTPLSYTLEAPSDFPLPTRVAALVAGVHAIANSKPER